MGKATTAKDAAVFNFQKASASSTQPQRGSGGYPDRSELASSQLPASPKFGRLGETPSSSSTAAPSMREPARGLSRPTPPAVKAAAEDISSTVKRFEDMPRDQLRKAILDMQRGLADLTRRLDTVGEENSLLREENTMLKDAIDDRVEGARPRR